MLGRIIDLLMVVIITALLVIGLITTLITTAELFSPLTHILNGG